VDERDLVQQLAVKERRIAAIRALVGGIGATELRAVELTDNALQALCDGVADPNPKVRWWSIQLLDHVPDPRSIAVIATALDDPIPRVRRNAAHALGCVACKPDWQSALPPHVTAALDRLATSDPNAKVRLEARRALRCRQATSGGVTR
jgi:HEAT repeat protein